MATTNKSALEFDVHFRKGRYGRQKLTVGQSTNEVSMRKKHIPRISRLMALAIRMDGMIQRGEIENYAQLALLGHVSRARVTQIMNLLNLAPDIQEKLLFFEGTSDGRDIISERTVRKVMKENQWDNQRQLWLQIVGTIH